MWGLLAGFLLLIPLALTGETERTEITEALMSQIHVFLGQVWTLICREFCMFTNPFIRIKFCCLCKI